MLRVLFFFLVLSLHGHFANAMNTDSVYYVRKSPFLMDLLRRSNVVFPIYPQYNIIPVDNGQVLIKTPQHLYITVVNTGIVFRYTGTNDSAAIFRRIDKTISSGYNISALYFTKGEELFNFGGYGFWKNNGTLRKYNFKDAEWDVSPVSAEIIPQIISGPVAWYDSHEQKLYVPFQRIINTGIVGVENIAGIIKKHAHVLDLPTGKWKNIGTVSKEVLDLYTDGSLGRMFPFERGQIIIHNYELYWIDFASNRVNVCRFNSFVQTFNRLTASHPASYIANGMYYCYDPVSNHYDSIRLDLSLFQPTGNPVWEYDLTYYYAGVPLILMAAAGLFFFYRRKKSMIAVAESEPVSNLPILPAIQFDEQEVRLLQLLTDKSSHKMRCTIEEINYILGLKDKNVGVQKKMRSDVINSINQKYKYSKGNEIPLILSVRSELDKRYFEYYLDPEKLEEVKSFIDPGGNTL